MTAKKKESVWDYPRPPRVENSGQRILVLLHDTLIAETTRSKRVLETSHPPVYYIPPEDIQLQFLTKNNRQTFCEWKGRASYYNIRILDQEVENAAWSYVSPEVAYESIRGYFAFYPSKMSACTVDGETVIAQPGDFYGGWITGEIAGPFKGSPGTAGW